MQMLSCFDAGKKATGFEQWRIYGVVHSSLSMLERYAAA